jgi:hypothetical protein
MIRARCLLAALLAAAPAWATAWQGPVAFEVRIEDASRRAVADAEVELELRDGPPGATGGPAVLRSDARGRVAVGGLAPGRWALEVRKSGYMIFRAEVMLSADARPEILAASQLSVPEATSTLRVRLSRLRNAPPAAAHPGAMESPERTPPSPVGPPVAPAPAPAPASSPALPQTPPSKVEESPTPLRPPEAPPAPVTIEPDLPIPTVERTPVAPEPPFLPKPALAPDALPATPPPAPHAPAAPREPGPAAPARVGAVLPHSCPECRAGESALRVEAWIAAEGGRCPEDARARLAKLARTEMPELTAALPGGCALLGIELPRSARYVGFRYEAASEGARAGECRTGRDCEAGACRFLGEPVLLREEGRLLVAALFESDAARRAGFVVYFRSR